MGGVARFDSVFISLFFSLHTDIDLSFFYITELDLHFNGVCSRRLQAILSVVKAFN